MSAVLYDFFTNMYIIQAIGFVAFGFGVKAFLCRNDRQLKILMIVQCIFLSLHFYLLGAGAATSTTVITGIRSFASLFAKMKWAAPLFMAAYVALGIYRYEYWVDTLPIISPTVSTFGLFYLKKVRMRLCFLFSTSLWIVHNFAVGSIGPFFMEVFIFSANAYTSLTLAGILKKHHTHK